MNVSEIWAFYTFNDDKISASRSDHFIICKVHADRLTSYKKLGSGGFSGGDVEKIYQLPGSLRNQRQEVTKSRNMRRIRHKASTTETILLSFPVVSNAGKRKFASKTRTKCGRRIVAWYWMLTRLRLTLQQQWQIFVFYSHRDDPA